MDFLFGTAGFLAGAFFAATFLIAGALATRPLPLISFSSSS
jgi:hypothetical protein